VLRVERLSIHDLVQNCIHFTRLNDCKIPHRNVIFPACLQGSKCSPMAGSKVVRNNGAILGDTDQRVLIKRIEGDDELTARDGTQIRPGTSSNVNLPQASLASRRNGSTDQSLSGDIGETFIDHCHVSCRKDISNVKQEQCRSRCRINLREGALFRVIVIGH